MIKLVLFDNDGVLTRWLIPQPAVKALAVQLQKNGVKTAILSNINWLGAWLYRRFKDYDGFDAIFLSYQEKLRKPKPEFYKLALNKFGVKPEEALFIDNRARNINGAKALGIKTIQAHSTTQVVKDIKELIETENKVKLL